jgi:hypothetical protein
MIAKGYATSNQELLEEQILELIDMADTITRSDLQGLVQVLASKYELMEG